MKCLLAEFEIHDLDQSEGEGKLLLGPDLLLSCFAVGMN